MKYLVDSDVLSEGTKPRPDANALRWLRRHNKDLLLSPIVLGELEFGILKWPKGKKREVLITWFEQGVRCFNILDFDGNTARAWARLLADLRRTGLAMPIKDSLIAASALEHGLTIATRNTSDFENAGVPLINPFMTS